MILEEQVECEFDLSNVYFVYPSDHMPPSTFGCRALESYRAAVVKVGH